MYLTYMSKEAVEWDLGWQCGGLQVAEGAGQHNCFTHLYCLHTLEAGRSASNGVPFSSTYAWLRAEDVLEDKLEESEDKEMILGDDILNPFTGGACVRGGAHPSARGPCSLAPARTPAVADAPLLLTHILISRSHLSLQRSP